MLVQGHGPYIPTSQSTKFGALTKASAGGFALAVGGGSSASIDSGNGSGHWQISSAGVLSPSSSGDTADLNAGPYTLGCTVNGVSVTLTIAITANAWSASTIVELQTAAQHASLSFGDRIKLRTAHYNVAQLDSRITRTTDPVGTWTAPSLKDASHPDKGYDLDTGNYVVVEPHDGAVPVIHRLSVDHSSGHGRYFRFKGLKCYRPPRTNIGISDSGSGVTFVNSCTDCAIDNCEVWSNPYETGNAVPGAYSGIVAGGADTARILIYDNYIHDVVKGTYTRGPGCQVIGNTMRRVWEDFSRHEGLADDFLSSWNKRTDYRAYDAIIGAHPDCLQFNCDSVDFDNVRIIGDLCWPGDYAGVLTEPQGFFGIGSPAGHTMTNLVIAGNLYVGAMVRGISLGAATDPVVRHNTIIYAPNASGFGHTDIIFEYCVDGVCRDNIVEALRISSTNQTGSIDEANNISADPDAGSGPTSYAALFADGQVGTGLTDPVIQLAIKAGSAADTASPKAGAIGTGYVNFATRETSFPWA